MQLEKNGVEEVVDDALPAVQAEETTRRLADQDVGGAQRVGGVARAALQHGEGRLARQLALAARHQRRREVLGQLRRQVPRANSGAGHPIADHVRRVQRDLHVDKPSHTPRSRAMLGRLANALRSSMNSAPMRPTPR